MKLLADENINRHLLRGLLRRQPDLDILRAQEVGLGGLGDPAVLEWAAREERVLITYDVSTMPDFAYERIAEGLPMPGIVAIRESAPIGQVIEDLLIILGAGVPGEWEGRILHLPL